MSQSFEVFSSTVPEKPKKMNLIAALKKDAFKFVASIVAKHQKIEGGKHWCIFFQKKVSQGQKKQKKGPFGFFNIHSVAKHLNIAERPIQENFPRIKVSQCKKNLKWDTLVSPGI